MNQKQQQQKLLFLEFLMSEEGKFFFMIDIYERCYLL